MAIIKQHSYDAKRIKRCLIGKLIENGRMIRISTPQQLGSYYGMVGNGILTEPNGCNFVTFRIDKAISELVGYYKTI